jgi:cystathionine beta-lyase/cystathionine gamma-synthase
MLGNIKGIKAFTFGGNKTWSAANAGTASVQTVSVPGLRTGDLVLISKRANQTGLAVESLAKAFSDDTLSVKFINPTAGNITPTANEVWTGIIFTSEPPSNSPLI